MDDAYDICLTDTQYPNEMLVINNLNYDISEEVSYTWLNSKEGRDYFWLNHGERPDFVQNYKATTITKNQLNRYL